MPRRNRVDPFGDLHGHRLRGLFTGNRGCLVDSTGDVVRHHRGNLWIVCVLEYREWAQPLAQTGTWTPLFFLDDAVALAAGHRPCGFCRREDYESYRRGVGKALAMRSLVASDLNRLLQSERLVRGRGLERAADRKTWKAPIRSLPEGSVIVLEGAAHLIANDMVQQFSFQGWQPPVAPPVGDVQVLTPPTSVAALAEGFEPRYHPSATITSPAVPRVRG